MRTSHEHLGRAEYDVDLTADTAVLPPVRFKIRCFPLDVQDYFTPDEARTLARELMEAAWAADAEMAVRP